MMPILTWFVFDRYAYRSRHHSHVYLRVTMVTANAVLLLTRLMSLLLLHKNKSWEPQRKVAIDCSIADGLLILYLSVYFQLRISPKNDPVNQWHNLIMVEQDYDSFHVIFCWYVVVLVYFFQTDSLYIVLSSHHVTWSM